MENKVGSLAGLERGSTYVVICGTCQVAHQASAAAARRS